MNDSRASEIRKEILDLVKEYHKASPEEDFSEGNTTVRYAGRIYDAQELVNAVDASLDFWLTEGRYSEELVYRLAQYINVDDVILVNSGSSANLLALSALTSAQLGNRRIKPGDEVITVAASFPTTVNPIIQCGAIPVFVDVELGSYAPDIEQIRAALSEKSKAVMMAHPLGVPFDVCAIKAFCEEHGLWLVEDCCDALGATVNGQSVGTFGDLATLSFYPAHQITMGEGGAVYSNNPELARIVRSFRDWGRDCYCSGGENNTCGRRFTQQFGELPYGYDHKYVYSHIGYNLKITDIQAAIGCAQMEKIAGFVQARRNNWKALYSALEKYGHYFILPCHAENTQPSFFGFAITIRADAEFTRAELVGYLEGKRIETRALFCGNLIRHPAYLDTNYRVSGELLNTDLIMENTFFIGVYPGIDSQRIDYIVRTFDAFFEAMNG